jgi:hypothetical protein
VVVDADQDHLVELHGILLVPPIMPFSPTGAPFACAGDPAGSAGTPEIALVAGDVGRQPPGSGPQGTVRVTRAWIVSPSTRSSTSIG